MTRDQEANWNGVAESCPVFFCWRENLPRSLRCVAQKARHFGRDDKLRKGKTEERKASALEGSRLQKPDVKRESRDRRSTPYGNGERKVSTSARHTG